MEDRGRGAVLSSGPLMGTAVRIGLARGQPRYSTGIKDGNTPKLMLYSDLNQRATFVFTMELQGVNCPLMTSDVRVYLKIRLVKLKIDAAE